MKLIRHYGKIQDQIFAKLVNLGRRSKDDVIYINLDQDDIIVVILKKEILVNGALFVTMFQPKDTHGDTVDDSSFPPTPPSAQPVPPGCIPVPPGCIPVPTGNVLVPIGSLPVPTGSIPVPTAATMVPSDNVLVHSSSSTDSIFDGKPTTRFPCPSDLRNHNLSHGIFSSSSYDDEFDTALNNVASSVEVSLRDNHTDFQHCLFACFLSQVEPRSVAQALEDPSWVDAMQEEMQQFKFQNVWILVDLSPGKYAIGTNWILKNKRDVGGLLSVTRLDLLLKDIDSQQRIM
nr:hypothetical protein [Tanacetum cinerariifolium]